MKENHYHKKAHKCSDFRDSFTRKSTGYCRDIIYVHHVVW